MFLFKSGLLLLFLLNSIEGQTCVIDQPLTAAWERQLKMDIIQCSKEKEPPDVNNTQVYLKFILKSFYFDQTEEVLSMYTWLIMFWNDKRLSWKPENYDGITEVLIETRYVWIPNLRLYSSSSIDTMDLLLYDIPECRINNFGRVSCIARVLHESVCNSKLSDWPYDIQNCSFKFGPSIKSPVTFKLNSSPVVTFGAEYGPGWNIVDHTVKEEPNSTVQFILSFVLERQGVGLAASVVVPPLVLLAITFISLFLEVDSGNRFGLLCFSLLNQFFFLQVINNEIPSHDVDSPTVLYFMRSLIFWTILTMGITFFLRYLKNKSNSPPYVVEVSMYKISNSYGKYLIWPRWDSNIEDDGGNNDTIKNATLWADFASVVNFLYIVLVAITFVTNFFLYIPQQPA